MEIKDAVRKIIKETSGAEFGDNQPLIMTHCIDSMDVITIVAAMEITFKIEIAGDEITFDNFDTIDKMSSYIETKMEAANRNGKDR